MIALIQDLKLSNNKIDELIRKIYDLYAQLNEVDRFVLELIEQDNIDHKEFVKFYQKISLIQLLNLEEDVIIEGAV